MAVHLRSIVVVQLAFLQDGVEDQTQRGNVLQVRGEWVHALIPALRFAVLLTEQVEVTGKMDSQPAV